ncbi:MAG: DUF5685 family protein [Lachnospiraceae bacterium]|nr:DUF5685 family protein [Lachnospiraceae bacterium]
MFGYVTINEEELKIKDYHRYRSFYCGLCHCLKERYGFRGEAILSNDMTFADILLNALYELPLTEDEERCAVHPFKKQKMLYNEITDYCADMTLMLAYFKGLDDVADENSSRAKAFTGSVRKYMDPLRERYPRQIDAIESSIRALNACEADKKDDLDLVSGLSGKMTGEILVWREDEWSDVLKKLGFFLGKFIYLCDAYEDLEKDAKKGCYNPWEPYRDRKDFDALVENTLTMMMAEAARAYEILPIVQDTEILRNILYSGVWSRFAQIQKKRDEEKMKAETLVM